LPDLIPTPESPTQPSRTAEPFECELRFSGRAAAWIRLGGELDPACAQQFAQSVEQALSTALLAIVDLRQLTFIDSTGLHVLIEADARARHTGRRLVVVRGPAHIDRLFDLVGLSDRLRIIDLKPAAVAPPEHPAPSPPTAA
jgi:anti-sigma B factor antagonist